MSKPLWKLADDLALAKLLGDFRETRSHTKYGPYGFVGSSRLNKRTHDALWIAAYISDFGPIQVTQGGLNVPSRSSANTHVGLDVSDIVTRNHRKSAQLDLVEAGMACGVVIFLRGITYDDISDGMVEHGHCVMIGAQSAHPDARAQLYGETYSYENGGAGLAGLPWARWDTEFPARKKMIEWKDSKYNPMNGWRP